MANNSHEWQMPRRSDHCERCGRHFEVGDLLRSRLIAVASGYDRRDTCAACPEEAVPPGQLATWLARRPQPAERKRTIDREALFQFFCRLDQPGSPEQMQFRFVLALLLWRKRVLTLTGSEPAGGGSELWTFQEVKSSRVHLIERPNLAEDELDRLSSQIEELLASGEIESSAETIDA